MLFDINILSIATILQANPTLLEVISFNNFVTFLELSKLLKPVIASWKAANATLPPKKLPEKVSEFFKEVLGLSSEQCDLAWTNFSGVVWNTPMSSSDELAIHTKHIVALLQYGISCGIGVLSGPCSLSPMTKHL